MSGYALCRAIKCDERLRALPVVLLTSLADPLDIIRGLECGADNYLTSPTTPSTCSGGWTTFSRTAGCARGRPRMGPPVGAQGGGGHHLPRTRFVITSEKEQILDLLISSFEELIRTNAALRAAEEERAAAFAASARRGWKPRPLGSAPSRLSRAREEANRAKGEFLAMMSHDLRTPLNAIGGYAQLLALGVRGPVTDEQRADLERIRYNQGHLLALVNDVLNFARLERGGIPITLAPLPVRQVLAGVDAVMAGQLAERGLTYEASLCEETLTVQADHERLEQVLVNLLGNALKFTPRGGRVTLACSVQDGAAALQVRDTGIGIPAAKLEQIFDPFMQVDARRTGTQEGVGLGLAISRDLARRMGGELTVASEVGVGSTFTLVLPLASGDRSDAARTPHRPPRGSRRPRVGGGGERRRRLAPVPSRGPCLPLTAPRLPRDRGPISPARQA
jgi:signal transduction histidine kinase